MYPRILIPLTRTLSRDSWCLARNQDAVRRAWLFADSRIPIPDSLLGKRGSVRVGSAQLFSREVRGLRGLFGSSAAARVCGVYINSKRSKKTAPADEAVLRTSRTSR